MTNLGSVLKSRDITLPTKVPIVLDLPSGRKAMVFQWSHTPKIDAFKLWCWRRLLKVPWTARRANYSILREINDEYSLEGLMLKLSSSILSSDVNRNLVGKVPDGGKD